MCGEVSVKYQVPNIEDLRCRSAELGLPISHSEAEDLLGFAAPFIATFQGLDALDENLPGRLSGARTYWRPTPEENPLGAWQVKASITDDSEGPLARRSVAIKDNIFVAGLPTANGTDFLSDFVPEYDATVVKRILAAGATIVGKSVCEYLCTSGGSLTAASGFVHNPRKHGYSAGGSSSGSAALVGSGAVDLALGCDQAGSIRIPSSWSGTYGMKPTHGLVPYTGIMGMEASLDHVGPITSTVADNALMLEVLAGYDEWDARQRDLRIVRYSAALGRDVRDIRIGVVKEGFGHALGERVVDSCVLQAAELFGRLGASVEQISLPEHATGMAIWGGVLVDGFRETFRLAAQGFNHNGPYSPGLYHAMRDWPRQFARMPVNLRLLLLIAYLLEPYRGAYYGKAKNLIPWLKSAYDRALDRFDLLLMPTTIMKAQRNPPSLVGADRPAVIAHAFNTVINTCQTDATGHPAMSIPCGLRDGLPIGMMLIGRHFDEASIYRAAYAFEQSGNWQSW